MMRTEDYDYAETPPLLFLSAQSLASMHVWAKCGWCDLAFDCLGPVQSGSEGSSHRSGPGNVQ